MLEGLWKLQLFVAKFCAGDDRLRDLHGALLILAGAFQGITAEEHYPILSAGD